MGGMERMGGLLASNRLLITLILVLVGMCGKGSGKYMEGEMVTGDNWIFMARFCFLSLEGKFEYDIEYPEEYSTQNLDLYYDTHTQWDRVYGDEVNLTSCRQKESVLQVENNQFINLTTETLYSGCRRHQVAGDNSTLFRCRGSRNFKTARYKFWLTNGDPWDFFHYHFSADEFYILPILMVYGVFNLILLILTFKSAIQTFGVSFLSLSYLSYGMNGYGMPNGKLLGRVLESASEITFLLLLILLAKGYTVTRARLRQWSAIKVTVFVCAYSIMYAGLFLAERLYFDPGKGGFYYPFFCFYTLWFVASPAIIILGNNLIAKWVREKVVAGVEHAVALVGHAVFLVLTRPGAHNKNFPYHVRTTQIGVMEALSANTTVGNHTLDEFGHHGYGVSPHNGRYEAR